MSDRLENFEIVLICALMLADKHDVGAALGQLKPSDFSHPSLKDLFKAIALCHKKGSGTDFLTVADVADMALSDISEMIKSTASHASLLPTYVERVIQHARIREVYKGAQNVINFIESELNWANVDELRLSVNALHQTSLATESTQHEPEFSRDILELYADTYEARINGTIVRQNIGIENLDKQLGGVNPSDFIVVCGCPAMGKSELAITILEQADDALMFSLEMSNEQVIERTLAIHADLSINSTRSPQSHGDFERAKMLSAFHAVNERAFYLYDKPAKSVPELVQIAIAHKRKHPDCELVIVDHAGLVKLEKSDKVTGLGELAMSLKNLAKEISTPVILLSQVVSKDIAKRDDKRPRASDLKYSSELEDNADIIVAVHREAYYNEHCEDPHVTELIVLKHRHGNCGTAYVQNQQGHIKPMPEGYQPERPKKKFKSFSEAKQNHTYKHYK